MYFVLLMALAFPALAVLTLPLNGLDGKIYFKLR